MNCFTRKSKYPRTTTLHDYPWPPPEAYKPRCPARLSVAWSGRPVFPGCVPYRPHVDKPNMLYNPMNEIYRERRMKDMLEEINRVNWTSSRHMCVHKKREQSMGDMPLGDTMYRRAYKERQRVPPDLSLKEPRFVAFGALPRLYSVRPNPTEHLYVVKCTDDAGCRPHDETP